MHEDGEYDNDYSCDHYTCNFLHNISMERGRIDRSKIIPDTTSTFLQVHTKLHMIPLSINLMKPCPELSLTKESYNKVYSNSGEGANEIGPELYNNDPEKHSMKKLGLTYRSSYYGEGMSL